MYNETTPIIIKNNMHREEFPIINTDDNTYIIGISKPDYEFVEIDISGNIIYKKHNIIYKELYNNIRQLLCKFIDAYKNLSVMYIHGNNFEYGIDVVQLPKNIKKRWLIPKHLGKDLNMFNMNNIITHKWLMLPYEKTKLYTMCMFDNIILNQKGEIYLKVIYRNDGISIFGTLNTLEEYINLRDLTNIEWFDYIEHIINETMEYLDKVKYDDTYCA